MRVQVLQRAGRGGRLPKPGDFDRFVAMGGPMGATDDAVYPWISDKKSQFRHAIGRGSSRAQPMERAVAGRLGDLDKGDKAMKRLLVALPERSRKIAKGEAEASPLIIEIGSLTRAS